MATDFTKLLESGNWMEAPKFLISGDDLFEQADFSLEKRKRAATTLARLFPAELCRNLYQTKNFGLVLPLFAPTWPLIVGPLLEVGIDLADADPWDDEQLVERLRGLSEFDEAAFELRVRASLVRSGYLVQKIREAIHRTPDFLVRRDGLECELEVKFANASALDKFVRDEASPALMHRMPHVNGFNLKLFGDPQLEDRALDAEGLKEIAGDLHNMVRAFVEAAKSIEAAPRTGRFDVAGYGYIEVEAASQGLAQVSPLVFPEQDDEKRARRVFALVSKSLAKGQFSGTKDGVFVVGVFHKANLPLVEDAMWSWVSKAGRTLRPTQMIVLVDNVKSGEYRYTQVAYPICTRPHRSLTKAQLRLARAAGGAWHGRAELMRRTRPGEAGLRLDTGRSNLSMVKLAEVKMPPERSRITLRADGTTQITPLEHDSGEEA